MPFCKAEVTESGDYVVEVVDDTSFTNEVRICLSS